MKEFLKSVNMWQSDEQEYDVLLFLTHGVVVVVVVAAAASGSRRKQQLKRNIVGYSSSVR